MPRTYEQLTGYDREVIAQMTRNKATASETGRRLGRAPGTITREIARNGSPEGYFSREANEKAQARLKKPRRPRKVVDKVAVIVKDGLEEFWSPEQIVGRNRLKGVQMPCFMTIYRFLETPEGAKYTAKLRGAGKTRRRNKKVHKRIHNRVMIDKRPQAVDDKTEPGHWEGDTVRGPIKTPQCVMTLVERISQYLEAGLLSDRSALELNKCAKTALRKHDAESLTVDNGMEFASHEKLAKQTGTAIFFAHPGCPWERGLNEQVNGLLRQFFPKGTDFGQVSPAELRRVVELLNNRPRKSLGYKTPNEVHNAANFALVK